jgi:hypothetical protein
LLNTFNFGIADYRFHISELYEHFLIATRQEHVTTTLGNKYKTGRKITRTAIQPAVFLKLSAPTLQQEVCHLHITDSIFGMLPKQYQTDAWKEILTTRGTLPPNISPDTFNEIHKKLSMLHVRFKI